MMNRKKLVTEMGRMRRDAFIESEKLPLIVVLDNVRSLHNVGSVFRTSDAFRVERILLCGITATPPQAEIHKTALGAEDVVDWEYFESALDAVEQLHAQGYKVYSIEQCDGSIPLQSFETVPGEKYAVVLGNEVKGVQQEVVDMSDGCIELPQYGTKHSLNVSVTAGIVIWEFARQLLIE
jgi:tRNA G18 (ribose-2'-O)-methylase SpoU